jgi:hypothetical protein
VPRTRWLQPEFLFSSRKARERHLECWVVSYNTLQFTQQGDIEYFMLYNTAGHDILTYPGCYIPGAIQHPITAPYIYILIACQACYIAPYYRGPSYKQVSKRTAGGWSSDISTQASQAARPQPPAEACLQSPPTSSPLARRVKREGDARPGGGSAPVAD